MDMFHSAHIDFLIQMLGDNGELFKRVGTCFDRYILYRYAFNQ